MPATVETVYRKLPCRCGCKGRDPWHRQSYKRRVGLMVASDPTRGACKLPFGWVTLERTAYQLESGRTVYGPWIFDPSEYTALRPDGLLEEVDAWGA